MEGNGDWHLTVVHGKEALAVAMAPPAADAAWLERLREAVAQRSGVAVAHQKLLFRGRELTAARGAELADGAKLMLLKNASFHKAAAATEHKSEEDDHVEAPAVAKPAAVAQRLAIDVKEIDSEHVLLQASRGKSLYEFLFPTTATVAAVKSRVGGAIGLSGDAVRLILKGKTPKDDATLDSFVAATDSNRVLKCMVLLSVKQHDLAEREEEFRVIQNELTSVETDYQKLEKVLFRNFLSRDEAMVRLHALEDHVGRLENNLGIVEDQLRATKLVQGSATLRALENAKLECASLKSRVDELARRFESNR